MHNLKPTDYKNKIEVSSENEMLQYADRIEGVFKKYNGLIIKYKLRITDDSESLYFENCIFEDEVGFDNQSSFLNFESCFFLEDLNLQDESFNSDIIFSNFLSFKKCSFFGYINFNRCEFKSSLSFIDSIFWTPLYITSQIESGLNLTECTFYKNVYIASTIGKNLILNRSIFKRKLNIAYIHIVGKIDAFDMTINYFHVREKKKSKEEIEHQKYWFNPPISHKERRETFRKLKLNANQIQDKFGAVKFSALEKTAQFNALITEKPKSVFDGLSKVGDGFILIFGFISNLNGRSWFVGIIFTLIIGLIFFHLSELNSSTFIPYSEASKEEIYNYWGKFIDFLNPTHKISNVFNDSTNFYVKLWDFVGRILVGFGIYQTLIGFRKYSGK